ncbi:glycoprotein IX (platelet) [Scomber japonicus]|uniref:glycoprotein IX (platelet) n=1 Tax=Scomber japonicus TaxID=13676 RepID=UPI00230629DC|nr:glycoprotein IX (platelet) [Scomber japonicus]
MLSSSGLTVFLLLAASSVHAFGQACSCSDVLLSGLQVNCNSLNLVELPHLPPNTTELHVQDNRLTSVSSGQFDRLVGLKKVSLSGNPFHCDCRIQYLRSWLLKNKDIVSQEPRCASPISVAQKAISELSDEYFSSCVPTICTGGTYNIVMGLMLCCLIFLLVWTLTLARNSTFILFINKKHSKFKVDSLHSLKPKHRRRLPTDLSEVSVDSDELTWTDDLERPLMSMDLLPQVLDVLHTKHNIKIKAT